MLAGPAPGGTVVAEGRGERRSVSSCVWRARRGELTRECQGFRDTLASKWSSAGLQIRRPTRLGCAPADRNAADKAAMLALPPVAPVAGWRATSIWPRPRALRQQVVRPPVETDVEVRSLAAHNS